MSLATHVAHRLRLYVANKLAPTVRNERDDRHLIAMLPSILREDSNAIDVGAHRGGILREIVRVAPNGHHVAIEPLPVFAERLTSAFPSVTVHAAAAAERAGSSQFQWVELAPEYSGLLRRSDVTSQPVTINVPVVRIDDVAPERPAYIKIDVEGGEEGVLRGAQETLARYRPVVSFEHGTPGFSVYGTTPEAVYALLTEPGLRVFDMDGAGPFSLDEFVEIVAVGERFNFLAAPV